MKKRFIETISQKRSYGLLLIKVAGFLSLLFLVDFFVGKGLATMYDRQKSGWELDTKYAMEETKAAILIMGSSRAQHSYNSEIFANKFAMTCYNAGRDGQAMQYHYPVLKSILKRYSPKLIVLDCEHDMFSINTYSYERISCLLPLYRTHPEIRPLVELRSSTEKIKLWSKIYPYNSLIFKLLSANIKNGRGDKGEINGYRPLYNVLDEPIRVSDNTIPYQLDTVKLRLFQSFITDCKNANIKLYVVTSPYFSKFIGKESSIEGCRQMAEKNAVKYLDFSQDSFYLSKSKLFDDTAHVNHNGAVFFSNSVCDKILLDK